MRNGKVSRTLLLSAVALAFALMLPSCTPITKGDVYQEVSKNIRSGADRAEVRKYLDSLKVKGAKPVTQEYKRDTSGYPVYAPDGKAVQVEGFISAKFESVSGVFIFCHTVWVVFYFDKSDKLINYHIDC